MVDGTFWSDDEMIRLGVSKKRAREIGHLPQAGAGGMIEVLEPLKASRKVLIHINNTNTILNEDSPEHRDLKDPDIEAAHDVLASRRSRHRSVAAARRRLRSEARGHAVFEI